MIDATVRALLARNLKVILWPTFGESGVAGRVETCWPCDEHDTYFHASGANVEECLECLLAKAEALPVGGPS